MKKILYVFDDINYNSGAKKVTIFQMKEMQRIHDIYLLSLAKPKENICFLDEDHVLDNRIWSSTELYTVSFKKVMNSKEYSLYQKFLRTLYAVSLRFGAGNVFFERIVQNKLIPVMESFDDVIVVSEASKLRRLVSRLKNPKKIQWIHTDYARWSEFSGWSKAVTKYDASIYQRFNTIVVLSCHCKSGMIEKIPSIEKKTVIIPNMINGEKIRLYSQRQCPIEIDNRILNFITVARIDQEKRIDVLLEIASEMQHKNIVFKWYVVGDGPLKQSLEEKSKSFCLEEYVIFLGYMDNPYPIMLKCDALVLLSKYEGTPVTIDEAMVLGIKIIAPKIGGIAEQVKNYDLSCLVENNKFDLDEFVSAKCCQKVVFDYIKENMRIAALIERVL